ncbi:hypothetical protein Tco_0117837 [Tanacetum coccineum]
MKDEGLKRQRRNSSNDDKILEDLLKEGNKINIDDLLKRIKTREVRARTLFVLLSSNRGRLLGIIDLMRQKNKRMKQERFYKREDSTKYAKEEKKIKINVKDKD